MEESRTVAVLSPSASELETTLAQVQGVYAARAVLNANHQLDEIHIVATNVRKPKQIVRDIETLIFVKHGFRVDYRKISLVQLASEDLLRLPLARPEICAVMEENLGDQRRIRVQIQGAGKTVQGEAIERIDHPGPFYSAARATVQCIEKLVGRQIDVRIENVTTLRLDSREVALVILTCLIDNREETFVGASFVGLHQAESAARATLDALNRRVFTLTSRPPSQ